MKAEDGDPAQLRARRLERLEQADLGPRPVEVVAGAEGPIVAVAVEVVAEEADGLLVDDDLGAGDEKRSLRRGERVAGALDEAPGERLEDGDADRDAREVPLVLVRVADRRAGEVAEVVRGDTGHHRVEVHDAEPLAGLRVEEDIRDLRVVVGGAHRDVAARRGLGQGRGQRPPVQQGVDLAAALGDARDPVGGDRPLEGHESARCVVEREDRLVERRRGQVLQVGQEAAEGPCGLPGLGLGRGPLRRARALDPRHEPPGLARRVHVVRDALVGRDEREDPAPGVGGALAREARGHVAGDPHHVLHHLVGVVEDVAVDLLEDEPAPAGPRLERRDPGVVDEAARVRLEREHRAGDGEAGEGRGRVGRRRDTRRAGRHAQRSRGYSPRAVRDRRRSTRRGRSPG